MSELDPEAVLQRILEEAREITRARYAALGVLNEDRTELERFITSGIDPAVHRMIGDLPRGRGVLGMLIHHAAPVRVREVGAHPQSYGFPPGHPPMRGFLGVPIVIRGEAWGNLYLTEPEQAEEFSATDQDAAEILAQWAATAIENARLHASSERRRDQAEQAVRGLEAARTIADAIGSVADLDRVLELIVKRGRALISAKTLLIMLREGDSLVIAASAGHIGETHGRRLPIVGSTSGRVLEHGRPQRITDVESQLMIKPEAFGVPDAHTALLVPMLHRGVGIGVLAAFDHGGGDAEPFSAADEQLLRAFASSAANAVAIKQSVQADRLRSAIASAEAERRRWARELHDETLQALGALRVLLASAVRRGDPENNASAMRQAISDLEHEIDNLRGIITDLRPSLLDDLGLVPAIEALLERRRAAGLDITSEIKLADSAGSRLSPELETTVYRLVQEALTNVVKHAHATAVDLSLRLEHGEVRISVRDNGVGFDAGAKTAGFGLAGMRERVYLAGGTLEIESGEKGTTVCARMPVSANGAMSATSLHQQSAS